LTDWYPENTLKEFLMKNERFVENTNINEIGIEDICQEITNIFKNKGYILKKYPFIKSLVDSYTDLDRVDHLSRDAYGSGIKAALLNFYMIIHNFKIAEKDGKFILGIKKEGIPPIIHLLTAREILYESFYSHPIVRAYESEFQRALIRLLANTDLDIDEILLSIDYFAFKKMLDYSKKEDNKYSQKMLNRILSQRPHRLYMEYRYKKGAFGEIEPFNITINEMEEIEERISKKLDISRDDIMIYIEWTGNMEELARLSFGKKIEIPVLDRDGDFTIEDYHPWIKQVLIDWTNRSSCRVYLDPKIPYSTYVSSVIQEELQDHGIIGN